MEQTNVLAPRKKTRHADANNKKATDNKPKPGKSAKANIAQTPSAQQNSTTSTSTTATTQSDSVSSNASVAFQQPTQQSMMHQSPVPDSIQQPYPHLLII